ncbi:MAG: hypothetical protein KDD82_28020 [Planctomycetes bacterium]|nr:hypothetical protein [Planctomycetota bacterium]
MSDALHQVGLLGCALACGLVVAGCSQGSGIPLDFVPQSTAAPATVAPDRADSVAFGFTSTDLGGDVRALGATEGGAVLAARGAEVVRVTPGQDPQQEVTLAGEPTSFATVGAQVYVATHSPANGGALLVREEVDGAPAWRALLETDAESVSVARVGSDAIVLTGGAPFDGEVLRLSPDGSMTSLARFPSTQPTQAIEFAGSLYVAGVTPISGGLAAARLGRVEPGQALPVVLALPVVATHAGTIEQRIAGLGVRTTDAGERLMLVVGEHDPVSGQDLGGYVATTDGVSVEVTAEFDHEPRGVAFVGDQPFVGFTDGKLLTSSDGAWREVTGLPATLGIEALLSDHETLWIAARGALGARLFAQAPALDEFADLPRGFADEIHALLTQSCLPCHSDPSRPFRLGVDSAADLGSTLSFVDRAAPETSSLLTKATGSTPHGGGAVFTPEDPRYLDVLKWIEQGAPEQAGELTFSQHVAPIYAAVNCVRCHDLASQRPFLMSSTADVDVDYAITVAYVNTQDPEQSELLLRTSATLPHPAQGIPNPSRRRDVVLRWIADGMQRGPDPAPAQ